MKAALLTAPAQIAIRELEAPSPRPGEVLIEPLRAGVCGSDVSFFLGHRTAEYPLILGHEFVGRVVAPGHGTSRFRAGQRVTVEPNFPCGVCDLCRAGRGWICSQKRSVGLNVPGCFAERISVPEPFVWAVPDSISDADAASIEPMAVSFAALRRSGARSGDTIAVVGCGVVGLLLAHAAVGHGIRVLARDILPEKEEMARQLGAVPAGDADLSAWWRAERVSTVFECAGTTGGAETALECAPRGSTVMLLGLGAEPVRTTPLRLVREGIRVEPSLIYDHPADFASTIELVAEGKLQPARIVTATRPLDSISEAIQLAATGRAGKIHLEIR